MAVNLAHFDAESGHSLNPIEGRLCPAGPTSVTASLSRCCDTLPAKRAFPHRFEQRRQDQDGQTRRYLRSEFTPRSGSATTGIDSAFLSAKLRTAESIGEQCARTQTADPQAIPATLAMVRCPLGHNPHFKKSRLASSRYAIVASCRHLLFFRMFDNGALDNLC